MTKRSRILTATTGPADWQQFLAQPQKQWRPGYSAWALAHWWEASAGFLLRSRPCWPPLRPATSIIWSRSLQSPNTPSLCPADAGRP